MMWARVQMKRALLKVLIQKTNTTNSCICLRNHHAISLIRKSNAIAMYSVHTDPQRQKAVLETAAPKIILNESKALKDVRIWDKVDPYIKLMRLDKPVGILLLFWPCAWGAALGAAAAGPPAAELARLLAVFAAGSVVMRGAGCTFNDIIDRDVDRKVSRTAARPLASGAVSRRAAGALLAAQLAAGLGVLLQLDWPCVALGASSLVLVATYPFAKRFTDYPQVHLGAAFSWGAPLGHAAAAGALALPALPLYAAAVAWTVLYDTVYAFQDVRDDPAAGVRSAALAWRGRERRALGGAAAAGGALLLATGALAQLEAPYYAAVALAGAHVARQIYTLKPDCPEDCAKKFRSNNWVGLIILLGIVGGGYRQYLDRRKENIAKEELANQTVSY